MITIGRLLTNLLVLAATAAVLAVITVAAVLVTWLADRASRKTFAAHADEALRVANDDVELTCDERDEFDVIVAGWQR